MKRAPLALLFLLSLSTSLPVLAAQDISKVNGGISAEAGSQYRDLDTVNGGIRVGERAQVRDVETVNGGITVASHASARNLSTVNGGIRADQQVTVAGDVETVNGSVFFDRGSQVDGSIETVNGSIGLVATRLGKGIETVNGDITVGVGSHVGGGIRINKPSFSLSMRPARKPRVVIGPNAVVDGPLEFQREVVLYVHTSARIGPVTGATAQPFSTDTAPQE